MLPNHSEMIRSFCEVLAPGLLIVLFIVSFSTKSVDLQDTSHPSDIRNLRIIEASCTLTR
jgi:hypothetical protein